MNIKSLFKDTALYGLSSIVGRFLNYLLVTLYTYYISAESGGYGIVTNLYAYTALFLAILTFGMETTFFRFAGKEGEDQRMVYSSALRMVGGVALAFLVMVLALLRPVSGALGYGAHPEYIACFAFITAQDAFQAIMFAHLRQQHRPVKFVTLKLSFIVLSIALNLFIFLVMRQQPSMQGVYDRFNGGVGLIFFANLICTTLVSLAFIPEIKGISYGFDRALAGRMLRYTWPLLLLSLVGILNQVADKILFPKLMPGEEGMVQLGIYGACVKIAMIMSLLTQAFRYAYEPIVFSGGAARRDDSTLADGMRYFVIFTLLAFLAVVIYMPVLKFFVGSTYWEGLGVVPVVMMAEIFMGVYFNLSFWYKLSDQTWWGAVISAIGAAVMILVNVIGVPRIGYWACAWGGFAGYGTSMLLSYFIGQRKYPIHYDLRSMGLFLLTALALYLAYKIPYFTGIVLPLWVMLVWGTLLLGVYCLLVWKSIRKDIKK